MIYSASTQHCFHIRALQQHTRCTTSGHVQSALLKPAVRASCCRALYSCSRQAPSSLASSGRRAWEDSCSSSSATARPSAAWAPRVGSTVWRTWSNVSREVCCTGERGRASDPRRAYSRRVGLHLQHGSRSTSTAGERCLS